MGKALNRAKAKRLAKSVLKLAQDERREALLDADLYDLAWLARAFSRRVGRMLHSLASEDPDATARWILEDQLGRGRPSVELMEDAGERLFQVLIALLEEADGIGEHPLLDVDRPPAPPPGNDRVALQRWAKGVGVKEQLTVPLSSVGIEVPRSLRRSPHPIETVADAVVFPFRHILPAGDALSAQARRWLHQQAGAEPLPDRAPPWSEVSPPEEPRLCRLFEELLRLYEPLRREHGPRVFPELGLVGRSGFLPLMRNQGRHAFYYIEQGLDSLSFTSENVELEIRPLGAREPLALTEGREGARSRRTASSFRALTALEQALEVVTEPTDDQRDLLLELLGRDSWERVLTKLQRVTTPPDKTPRKADAREERIAWRIDTRTYGGQVRPVVQRAKKRGPGFTKGTPISAEKLTESRPGLLPQDLEAARRLRAMRFGESAKVIEALEGHPRVYLEGHAEEPVEVKNDVVRLVVEPSEGGFRMRAQAAGLAVDAGDLLYETTNGQPLIAFDGKSKLTAVGVPKEARRILQALEGEDPIFPASVKDQLLRVLHGAERTLPVDLPPDLEGEVLPGDPLPVARLTPLAEGGLRVQLGVRPLPGGPLLEPGEGERRVTAWIEGTRRSAERDLAAERAALDALFAAWTPPDEERTDRMSWDLAEPDRALDVLSELGALAAPPDGGPALARLEWPQDARRLEVSGAVSAKALRVRIDERRDWFGLDGEVIVDEQHYALAAMIEAARAGRRYVEVAPGRFVALEASLRERLSQLANFTHTSRGKLSLGPEASDVVETLAEEGAELEAAAGWEQVRQRLQEARSVDVTPPRALAADLRPYQHEGFAWLKRLTTWGVGACLADDMGLGKTVQALALLVDRQARGPQLVVAPTSLLWNWTEEAQRFAPTLRPVVYAGADREGLLDDLAAGDLVITSYGLAVRDLERLTERSFATLVLDEAQAIKNANTQRAKAVRKLDAEARLALTGTPLENHLGELWSLYRTLSPGLFGSWAQFRERFAQPIERDRSAAHRRALSKTLRPFLLRRTKGEVAPELPPRTEVQIRVPLSEQEREHYDAVRASVLEKLARESDDGAGDGADQRFQILAGLTRLRLAACHPRLDDPDSPVPSSKLNRLLRIVADLRENGHRALVFSQFVKHLDLVEAALRDAGVTLQRLDGSTPGPERGRRVEAFQRGEGDVFLISLKAGGTGLNLTAADYVIHLDPWWNPAVEDQATDRTHRIGQSRPVTVYRLIGEGTIEEGILALHEDKRDLADSLLEDADAAGRLSTEELKALLQAPPAPGGAAVARAEHA